MKANTNFGGTSIRRPVDGFVTVRSKRFFTSKVPKPDNITDSPSLKLSAIASTNERTKRCVKSCV